MKRLAELDWPLNRMEDRLDVYEIPVEVNCEFEGVRMNVYVIKLEQEYVYGLVRNFNATIEMALGIGFNKTFLVRVDGKTFGIMKGAVNTDEFFVFDPHACGDRGECSPEGKCLKLNLLNKPCCIFSLIYVLGAACLLKFSSLHELTTHFQRLLEHLPGDDQIDICPVDVVPVEDEPVDVLLVEDENVDLFATHDFQGKHLS